MVRRVLRLVMRRVSLPRFRFMTRLMLILRLSLRLGTILLSVLMYECYLLLSVSYWYSVGCRSLSPRLCCGFVLGFDWSGC